MLDELSAALQYRKLHTLDTYFYKISLYCFRIERGNFYIAAISKRARARIPAMSRDRTGATRRT